MSPELETLDQLLGGEMPLEVFMRIYPDRPAFDRGILGLLKSGHVRLLQDRAEVPSWQWSEIINRPLADQISGFYLEITEDGARQIGG
jgi:hypothetical protein